MATLHVRNVPEPLYEALRRAAEENGRSIGSEAIHVLSTGLFGRPRRFPRPGTGRRLRAFDPSARTAIGEAQSVARELGHAHVGTEHVLLALASMPDLFVAALLARHGASVKALEQQVIDRVGRGSGSPEGPIPFAPKTKEAFELALRESLQERSGVIRPVHVLLGLVEAGSSAAVVLADFGIDAATVRAAPYVVAAGGPTELEFRVVELDGAADDWERQLNEPADDGFELVQIVGTRAVFRRPE